jgi:glucosamine 6-phosphate synthetase-like amidotransferase/phosphosugar isomerase protein
MLGYINSQEQALKELFAHRQTVSELSNRLIAENDIQKIYVLGSGTSYNASLAGQFYFTRYLKVRTIADYPTHFTNYEDPLLGENLRPGQVLVIGISQSGTSTSTINAVKRAEKEGYTAIAITQDMASLITKETKHVVPLYCEAERIPVETRGYSITVLELFLMAVEAARYTKRITDQDYQELMTRVEATLNTYGQAKQAVEDWYERNRAELLTMDHAIIGGYGVNNSTAIEGELKLGETYRHPVNHYDIEEMIHGPQNAFNDKDFIFLLASKEVEYQRVPLFPKWIADNQITDHVFVITDGDMAISSKGLRLPAMAQEDLCPLYFTLVFQITAARNCLAVGIDTSVRAAHRKAFAHIYAEDEQ